MNSEYQTPLQALILCVDSNKRSCRVDLHNVIHVIAMGFTALYQITAIFRQKRGKKFGFVGWTAGTSAMTKLKVKQPVLLTYICIAPFLWDQMLSVGHYRPIGGMTIAY